MAYKLYSKDVRGLSDPAEIRACLVLVDVTDTLYHQYKQAYAVDEADFVYCEDGAPTQGELNRTVRTLAQMAEDLIASRDRLQNAIDWAKAEDLVPPGLGDPA